MDGRLKLDAYGFPKMYTIHVSDAVPVTSGEYCNLEISATTKSCGSKGTVTI